MHVCKVLIRNGTQRRNAHGNGRHYKGHDKRDNEVGAPDLHQVKLLGHDNHEGRRDRRKAGGNNRCFPTGIATFLINAVRDQNAQRVRTHKRGHRINRGAPRRLPQRPHDGLHEHTDKFQQTKPNEKRQECPTDRHNEANRNRDGVPQERHQVFIAQHPRQRIDDHKEGDHRTHNVEHRKDRLQRAFLKRPGGKAAHRAVDSKGKDNPRHCCRNPFAHHRDHVIQRNGALILIRHRQEEYERTDNAI